MMLALLLAAALNAPASAADTRRDLTVVVHGVKDAHGLVRLDICRAESFLGKHCERSAAVPAQEGDVAVTVPDVPQGEWAVQAYHDRNADGAVNRNLLGMPTEQFGFSRAPPLGLKGPSFARAAFVHGAQPQTVSIKLRGAL